MSDSSASRKHLTPAPLPPPLAHAVLTPLQRGGAAGANVVAAPVCLQLAAPCGAAPAGPSTGAFLRGERGYAHLQKNQDHLPATGNCAAVAVKWFRPFASSGIPSGPRSRLGSEAVSSTVS